MHALAVHFSTSTGSSRYAAWSTPRSATRVSRAPRRTLREARDQPGAGDGRREPVREGGHDGKGAKKTHGKPEKAPFLSPFLLS